MYMVKLVTLVIYGYIFDDCAMFLFKLIWSQTYAH